MCAVSMVIDSLTSYPQFPKPMTPWPDPPKPLTIRPGPNEPETAITRELVPLLRDIIEKLDLIDKKLGAKDCDPNKKAKFLKALDDFMAEG